MCVANLQRKQITKSFFENLRFKPQTLFIPVNVSAKVSPKNLRIFRQKKVDRVKVKLTSLMQFPCTQGFSRAVHASFDCPGNQKFCHNIFCVMTVEQKKKLRRIFFPYDFDFAYIIRREKSR